ncbi:MAG: tRNA (guanosine(37)-N1)-methyltransferase TrmD [Pirellulales bacterium]|nr:tRNA (guanosine(37)-N1)-methyltransferase TrmD [Pirellulales bacterium]
MRFDVLTLFPEMFPDYLGQSLLKLAIHNRLVAVHLHQLRDWAAGRHHVVDDRPYGGGPGMILKAEPVVDAVCAVQSGHPAPYAVEPAADWRICGHPANETLWPLPPANRESPPEPILEGEPPAPPIASSSNADFHVAPGHLIMLTPQGRRLTQQVVAELAAKPRLLLLCGRYEGFDDRIRQILQPDELSIGDYILGGGEVAAMVVIDAVIRLIPGVLGDERSAAEDSFSDEIDGLEGPQFTRPREFRGLSVPDVLLRGNHAEIAAWRREQSRLRTSERRGEMQGGA